MTASKATAPRCETCASTMIHCCGREYNPSPLGAFTHVQNLHAELDALRALLAEYHLEKCEETECASLADCHICEVLPVPHDHAVDAKARRALDEPGIVSEGKANKDLELEAALSEEHEAYAACIAAGEKTDEADRARDAAFQAWADSKRARDETERTLLKVREKIDAILDRP